MLMSVDVPKLVLQSLELDSRLPLPVTIRTLTPCGSTPGVPFMAQVPARINSISLNDVLLRRRITEEDGDTPPMQETQAQHTPAMGENIQRVYSTAPGLTSFRKRCIFTIQHSLSPYVSFVNYLISGAKQLRKLHADLIRDGVNKIDYK